MIRRGKRQRTSRKFGYGVILTTMCLTITLCTVQAIDTTAGETTNTVPVKTMQTRAGTANPESAQRFIQTSAPAAFAGNMVEKVLNSKETHHTMKEILELLDQYEIRWEAYYNASGEQINMYCEDGTKLLFLSCGEGGEDAELDQMTLVMLNNQFYKQGFQAGYGIDLEKTADLDYYPQTAEYYLTETELMAMTQTDLTIALHEIYARHGMQMEEPFLQAVFSQKAWYAPKYREAEFVSRQETLLNKYEKENVTAILTAKKKQGFLDDGEVDYKVPRPIVEGSYIDLDGNGVLEQIVYDFIYGGPYFTAKNYTIMINMKVSGNSKISGEIDKMPPAVYTASLDGKTTQIIMSGRMNDGKPRTNIYAYQDGKAKLAGQIDANNLEIMEDCFWAYQYDAQQIRMERTKYRYENGSVVQTGITEAVKDDKGEIDNRMSTLIDSFDFEHSRVGYSEVVTALKHIGVSWKIVPNISGERLDLICDDKTVMILMDTELGEMELIMAGERLSERGFENAFLHENEAELYYYPQTSKRPLYAYELSFMDQTQLSIARNEIYARHGRRFVNPFLHAVFSRKSWYKPKYDGAEFDQKADELFNQYEKVNLKILVAAEKKLTEP